MAHPPPDTAPALMEIPGHTETKGRENLLLVHSPAAALPAQPRAGHFRLLFFNYYYHNLHLTPDFTANWVTDSSVHLQLEHPRDTPSDPGQQDLEFYPGKSTQWG